jgi:hypothetical protein
MWLPLSTVLAPSVAHDSNLNKLVQLIQYLDLSSRKILLDVCQTGRTTAERPSLHTDYSNITRRVHYTYGITISVSDMCELSDYIALRPIFRSFISMVLRNEVADYYSGAADAMEKGFVKEWYGGQNIRQDKEGLSYQVIDEDNFAPAQYSMYYQLDPAWANYARGLAFRFAKRIESMGIIYPQVQRKKNMSRETAGLLAAEGYRVEGKEWWNLGTIDLELHSHYTGTRVQGDCEMRMAWRYNELKPRLYYTTGGSAYWRSRFTKPLAVALMECIDSTRLNRRRNPEDIMYYLSDEDWLILWDMTTFTSTLSELKLFLYYLIKNLEESLIVQQNPLRVFDYRDGVTEITADKLLMAYNIEVNQNSRYSIARVVAKLFPGQDNEESVFHMRNSGPLGVHGNIGFSTAFHGFHAEAAIKKQTGCGVGDDMLGAITEDPMIRFFDHMKLIGDIEETKADVLEPLREEAYEQVSKFLKRRFTRRSGIIELGLQYAFPALGSVYNLQDEYHTMSPEPMDVRIMKFAGQVGALYWDLHATTEEISEEELELLQSVLNMAYKELKLDNRGSLPGRRHRAFKECMMVAIPPVYIDPCTMDWAEYLWENDFTGKALLPVIHGPTEIPRYSPGLSFVHEDDKTMGVLVDVGCVEEMRKLREWFDTNYENRRIFRSFLSREYHPCEYRYTSYRPDWIDQLVTSYDAPFYCLARSMV